MKFRPLFNRKLKTYEQGNISLSKKHQGVGIGLAIVKDLVEKLEGQIQLNSIIGSGTTFSISLPAEIRTTKKKLENLDNDTFKSSYKKILIVDDDPVNLMISSRFLKEFFSVIHTTKYPKEVTELIHKNNYDLILSDIQMPDLNGIDLFFQIEKLNLGIPVIAVTANSSTTLRKEYLEIGFADVVSKPYKKEDLIQSIYRVDRLS